MPTAADILRAKTPVATSLGSADLRRLAEGIRQRALFSARCTHAGYLQRLKETLAEVSTGRCSPGEATANLQKHLAALGYTPESGFEGDAARGVPAAEKGSLRDLSSVRRIKLQFDTNLRQASSLAKRAAGNSGYLLHAFPAWALARIDSRVNHRLDWTARWAAAGEACGWEGASRDHLVALKDSGIWAALGAGAGGYTDTLHTDIPPFAYGSGLGWSPVSRAECVALGLITGDEASGPADLNAAPDPEAARAALERLDPDLRARLAKDLEGW